MQGAVPDGAAAAAVLGEGAAAPSTATREELLKKRARSKSGEQKSTTSSALREAPGIKAKGVDASGSEIGIDALSTEMLVVLIGVESNCT